jgi:3-oxoacyl-[acyl-carrier-protein] synthase III
MSISAVIKGVGHYVPTKVLTNSDLEKVMNTNDAWIRERSGIEERRYFEPGTDTVSSMAYQASLKAIEKAGLQKEEIDFIVFATLSPDYNFPGSGVLLQRHLGLKNIAALDIRQQCAGFIYAISIAQQYIQAGVYKNVLVVGAEIQSNLLDYSDEGRHISVLFGDGAGAMILSAEENTKKGVKSTKVYSDGEMAEELYCQHPGSSSAQPYSVEMIENGAFHPYMNGTAVFKMACTKFPEVINEVLALEGKTTEDIGLLIPHQANLRIAEFVQKRLGLRDDQVFNNIQKYGNTTAASIPIALSEAIEQGKLKEGDLLCLAAFGSGFVWGATLIQY